jgi:hypothetical protein
MELATLTKAAINAALELDQGANYRRLLGESVKEIGDAFEPEQERHPRKHLGASLLGRECSRFLWLSWRWAFWKKQEGRMVRLFNRGHLEEARWIALVRAAGFHTVHLENGKQIRISSCGGHYGGSLDGMIYGCLEVPNEWGLLEFKTFNKNTFSKLTKVGVKEAKNEHYVQCQQYMAKKGLSYTLYCAVCKDDDEIHLEIIRADRINAGIYEKRAFEIITASSAPNKCSASPMYQTCKWCDAFKICHENQPVLKTCRSCTFVYLATDGIWYCEPKAKVLSADEQFAACELYELSGMFRV